MKEQKPYTIFMLVKTTTEWLKMKPKQRFEFLDTDIRPILAKYPSVKMRYFDSEAYNANFTDILTWETSELRDYENIIEELRESLFWGTYFEIVQIIKAVEDAYADFYKAAPIAG